MQLQWLSHGYQAPLVWLQGGNCSQSVEESRPQSLGWDDNSTKQLFQFNSDYNMLFYLIKWDPLQEPGSKKHWTNTPSLTVLTKIVKTPPLREQPILPSKYFPTCMHSTRASWLNGCYDNRELVMGGGGETTKTSVEMSQLVSNSWKMVKQLTEPKWTELASQACVNESCNNRLAADKSWI